MKNTFERAKRMVPLVASLAGAVPAVAEANVVHRPEATPQHELAAKVQVDSDETRKLMEKWGVEYDGTNIKLRLDPRDDHKPLMAGERNTDVTFGHVSEDTISVRWREADGDQGVVWITRGHEMASFSFDVGKPEHGKSRPHPKHAQAEHPGKFGEYGSTRVYGMHTEKPRPPEGMKWYYHNQRNNEKGGYWFLAPLGSH